jgi:N-acyl homoserine lactone hydrolase
VILVDTGPGDDHPIVNERYQPEIVSVVDALNRAGLDERDVALIVNTHLHFDHCGQNRLFPSVPVLVQRSEYAAAQQPRFTIPEWAAIEESRQAFVDGDAEVVDGVHIIATPGHTPGHQSVLIGGTRSVLLAGQCCYTCAEFRAGTPLAGDMHDETFVAVGNQSLQRLRALGADTVMLSHDPEVLDGRRT